MAILHINKKSKPVRSDVYDSYWQFAVKRFEIFQDRLKDPYGPWTNDAVLRNNRFTNVFRASDRVSQFLIDLQYRGEEFVDIFFKTMLFKIFNKIETYNYLEKELGEINYGSFDLRRYDELLKARMASGQTIYSAAYIMPSAGNVFGYKLKHSNHLALLLKMMEDNLHEKILHSKTLSDVYQLMLSYPSFGSFLAFQYTIDINYSELTDFSEMSFIVAGPGAKNGILKCFQSIGDYSFEDIIKMMADDQEIECNRLGLNTPNMWGRKMQLIDCQNVFCEVDKYLRGTNPEVNNKSGRTRIKQKYTVSKGPLNLFFPPKWNLNEQVNNLDYSTVSENIFYKRY